VLVVGGQHRGVPGAQPETGGPFPGGLEPDRLGQLNVPELVGQQGHAAAVLHRLQLRDVPGQDHLAVVCLGEGDQVGQVQAGHHQGLIDQQQRARPGVDWAAGAALPGQVAQKLRGVIGLRDARRQGVAGRLRRRHPDDPAESGPLPGPAERTENVGLAGPGGGVDHRYPLAVGQHRQRRGRLILAQARLRGLVLRVVRVGLRIVRAAF
jgi:hypothetical protein